MNPRLLSRAFHPLQRPCLFSCIQLGAFAFRMARPSCLDLHLDSPPPQPRASRPLASSWMQRSPGTTGRPFTDSSAGGPVLKAASSRMGWVGECDLIRGLASCLGPSAPRVCAQSLFFFFLRSTCELPLGPLSCERFLALARCKLWWMTPEWGSVGGELPPETQFLLLDLGPKCAPRPTLSSPAPSPASHRYALLLPLLPEGQPAVSGGGAAFRATLRPGQGAPPGGRGALSPSARAKAGPAGPDIAIRLESGDPRTACSRFEGALYAAGGEDPFALVASAMEALEGRVGTFRRRASKSVPGSLDLFGWCTWDAFYSKASLVSAPAGRKRAPPPSPLVA